MARPVHTYCDLIKSVLPGILPLLQDWASDISLFESGVQVNPNNVKLHNNYAMELKSAGRVVEAREQYKVCT